MQNTPISLCQAQQSTSAPAIVPNASVATLEDFALSPDAVLARKDMLKQVMHSIMREGTHYGKVPGCGDKPTLLKPGAESISSTFQLCPRYVITKAELGNGHREYEIVCELLTPNGTFVGSGVGSGTTMEGKYRFRQEDTGRSVPSEYWESRDPALLGGRQFKAQKRQGKWTIVERVEHDNPADYYNTVLKMAKKRAFVDAVLTATGASDIFTQDLEDGPEATQGQYRGNTRQQPPYSDEMDGLPPEYGQSSQQPSSQGAPTEQQRRAVFGACKSKGIDLNDLCASLSDSNTFGHSVRRVNELSSDELSNLLGWLNSGKMDFLASAA